MKKLKTKKVNSTILKSIPFNDKKELSGYIEKKVIHYSIGRKTNCKTFPDKPIVFHTHVDIMPSDDNIIFPDMPSPLDIIVFMLINNRKMYIKTPRIFFTFTKTKQAEKITEKICMCILENEKYWEKLVKENNVEMMLSLVLNYLKENLNKRNYVWHMSWKRLVEQIFKIKVKMENSDVKEHI